MIDPTTRMGPPSLPESSGKMVLRHLVNDRMGGNVPVWVEADKNTAALAVSQSFETALNNQAQSQTKAPDLMGYRQPEQAATTTTTPDESFGFGDLIDMVNPLQHIPIINSLYRQITGDTIKPVSRIIGGALFGGPIGVAGNLINVAVEHETGKDITGNAIAFITEGKAPTYKTETKIASDNPERNISNALSMKEARAYNDLPVSLLAFADMGTVKKEVQQPLHNQSWRYNA